jgi:hypothetical protein
LQITLAGRPVDKSTDGSPGDIEVTRILNARGGANKWRINGEEKSTEAVSCGGAGREQAVQTSGVAI